MNIQIVPPSRTFFILHTVSDADEPDRMVLSEITENVYGAGYSGGNADSIGSSGPQMISIEEEDLAGILDTPQGQYQMNNWLSGIQQASEADPADMDKYEYKSLWDDLAYRSPGLHVVIGDLIRRDILPFGDFLLLP